MMARRIAILLLAVVPCSCRGGMHDGNEHEEHGPHGPGGHEEGHGHAHGGGSAIAITRWTDHTELFVEFDPLVVGRPSAFAAHLTMLDDFSPAATGRVEVVFAGGGAPEERYGADPSATAGIFRPVARPTHAVQRDVTLVFESGGQRWEHDLGRHRVYANADQVPAADDDEGGEIQVLKEQQWKMPFSTAFVTAEALRPSFPVFARLEARADGEVTITAPAKGRLVADRRPLPVVGTDVSAGDVLARFVPQLEGAADVPTLQLAITTARLELQHATRERERLEGLLASGAVPPRRVAEARHAEATARAALEAGRERSAQFRRVQRTGPRGRGASLEIRTPLSGTVLEVSAVAGALVEDGAPLFRVVDGSTLWLTAWVPEVDQARIPDVSGAWFEQFGLHGPVEVDADAWVSRGGPVDETTRTVNVVFAIPNPDRRLRVGTRVRAHLLVGKPSEVRVVPSQAVIDDGGTRIVFVQTGGESFERRQVRTGIRDGARVEITQGLNVGERVVVEGAYSVKLASVSTSPPAHGHPH